MGHTVNPDAPAQRPESVVGIRPEASIAEAAGLMHAHHIGCLVVQEAPGGLAGIITERDILTRVVARGIDASAARVRDFMTAEVVTIDGEAPMETAQEVMAGRKVRHLPVIRDGRVVGIYSSRDLIARQVALDRAMRTAAEQVAMLSTSLKSLDFDEVVQMVTREVPRIFGAQRSALLLGGEDVGGGAGQMAVCHHCQRSVRELADLMEDGEDPGQCQVQIEQPPEGCPNERQDGLRVFIPVDMSMGAAQPAPTGRDAWGFLCMCGVPEEGMEPDVLTYKALLVQEVLNSNLAHARLYQRTKHQAMTDSLTGTGSRRLMEELLEAEFHRAQRYGRPFIVAMMDVDDYKEINDRLGHQMGDQVLRDLGACLAREKRETDVLARYGGDEFVLLMPETAQADAVRVIERIRRSVKRIPIPENLSITISCGIAEQPRGGGVNPNELIRRADIALYQAKKRGRDRTETWDEVSRAAAADTLLKNRRVHRLESRIVRLSMKSKEIFVQSVYGLARALEARDPYTKSHSENVMRYAVGIAQAMGKSRQEIDLIRRAAMIHDIGKIGVPDSILRKPGRLTREERRAMEEHPLIAVRILDQMRFLEREMAIVRHHHEHWDGRGYPAGLAGPAIPLGARALAVADALDAITSDRVYRKGSDLAGAMAAICQAAGTQFDPQVVEALRKWIARVEEQTQKVGTLTPQDLLDSQKGCILAA